jgi:hypothetical protein
LWDFDCLIPRQLFWFLIFFWLADLMCFLTILSAFGAKSRRTPRIPQLYLAPHFNQWTHLHFGCGQISVFFCFFNTYTQAAYFITATLKPLCTPHLYHYISPLAPCSPPRRSPCGNPVASYTMVPLQWCAAGLPLGGGHLARRAAAGCAADSAASRLREVLACAGATSFWVAGPTPPILRPISTIPSTSVKVCAACPWGMYSLKPVRRGGMMNSGATLCLGCVTENWYYPAFDSAAGLG